MTYSGGWMASLIEQISESEGNTVIARENRGKGEA